MAIMFAMITFLQFNFGGLFAPLKTVLSSVHRPVIQHGDIVWTNLAPYLIHPPRRGDMLYFDPPRFTIEQPGTLAGNLISVNITDYFQRVLAVEGDRVSRRNGVTIVNSRPLRPEEDAVGGQVLGDIEEFVVPQGRVFAPITRVPGDLFQSLAEAKGLSEVSDTSLPRLIYTKLREAGLPGREDWLGRAEVIVHPPQHRTFLRVTANP
jgi:signal peptidase I